jgi:hypothetical protein
MAIAGVGLQFGLNMEARSNFPDTNRLSVLSATILLAYAVMPFIELAPTEVGFQLPGIYVAFAVNFATITSILAAVLAAIGADWLARGHPRFKPDQLWRQWLLPGLTAWVLGVPLSTLEVGLEWWAVFSLGGLLLVFVFIAEYIVLDSTDPRHAPATIGLTAVGFALFLVLAIALRASGQRLFLELPALMVAVFLVVLRSLYLRLGGRLVLAWPVVIAVFIGQMAAGLHYWPLSPLQHGMILLATAYALTSLAGAVEEGRTLRASWVEPVVMLVVLWGLAALLGR